MNSVLSGSQLVEAHSKTGQELPAAGLKEFEPSHSWLEKKQVQSALDHRKLLLEQERVEKWSLLMSAEWIPEKHKAQVTRKGKQWEVFGHHSDDTDWLFPEETLYLMEMNCLECNYSDIPLSIQKGYSVLLSPQNGCSLNEYRVFAHLCRAGYRVVRHLPDLTVTAYERQIRLDQHLEQRQTYSDNVTLESEVPRPDLPPKKVLDLSEYQEISIETGLLEASQNSSETLILSSVPRPKSIEVIDLADSSEESSSEEPSSDSDIEIVHVSAPNPNPKEEPEEPDNVDDEDDIEVIEVPVPKKEILVATIESSDSEQDNQSGSESDRSYDGNWKRNQPKKRKNSFVRPAALVNFNFCAEEEFCSKKSIHSKAEQKNGFTSDTNQEDVLKENANESNSGDLIRVESPIVRDRPVYRVHKNREEILDMMPSMAACHKQKLMTIDTPDLRLVPSGISPKQQSYTYSTNSLRARVFRQGFRGRRFFHQPRFTSYNPYYNARCNFLPNQMGLQSPIMGQMFGSADLQMIARNVMQMASTLLHNMPQPNPSNNVVPFNPRPNNSVLPFNPRPNFVQPFNPYPNVPNHVTTNHSQIGFNPETLFDMPSENISQPSHIRFPDSSFNSNSPTIEEVGLTSQNFGLDHHRNSGTESDFDPSSSYRSFTPPLSKNQRNKFNRYRNRASEFGRARGRNNHLRGRFSPMAGNARPIDSHGDQLRLPLVDPAYAKPDVPLQVNETLTLSEDGNFIPLNTSNSKNTKSIEVISIDDDDSVLIPQGGVSNCALNRKRKRKLQHLKNKMAKKKMSTTNNNEDIKNRVIVFLDSPEISQSSLGDSLNVKQEEESGLGVNIKTEQSNDIKQEAGVSNSQIDIKTEEDQSRVKIEPISNRIPETLVKQENDSDVRVKVEQESGQNLTVEIKIESSSDTSSVVSLPITNLVKDEPVTGVKTEPENLSEVNVKTETVEVHLQVKSETHINAEDTKDGITEKLIDSSSASNYKDNLEINEEYCKMEIAGEEISETDPSRTKQNVTDSVENSGHINEIEVSEQNISKSRETSFSEQSVSKVTSWAEVKKHHVPLTNVETDQGLEEEEEEDDGEIQPLIKPKNCKTIESVLTALRIFSPFSASVPEVTPKLKISFDMYLPAEFRKSHRGLPHYRIIVFGGSESKPSPAQLLEVQTRFEDRVPILQAVVMPSSVVFYTLVGVQLPVDSTSYTD